MVNWQPEENLAVFIREMKIKYPGIVIYTIGDTNHSANPEVSQHAPEADGDIDACDSMPKEGVVTLDQLWNEAEDLRQKRDERILYVICKNKIFSSRPVGGVPAFTWRDYKGKYHSHLHLSVNDLHDDNLSPWGVLPVAEQPWNYEEVENAKLPKTLQYGMEDSGFGGWNHIVRAQALLNIQDKTLPDLDPDGVYGAKTVQKAAKVFKTNGRVMTIDNLCLLHGFSK